MKKLLTTEELLQKYKRKYRCTLAVLLVITLLTLYYLYQNYDYLAFKHFITQHYIYTNTLDKLYRDELNRDVHKAYYSNFDNVVIQIVTRQIRGINNDKYTYLYTPEQYQQTKQEEKSEAQQSEIKEISKNIVYVRISNFSTYTQKFLYQNKKMMDQYPNIIIDLRDNYGGDVFAMNSMVDLFLPKNKVIATDILRLFQWVHKTHTKEQLAFTKIVILQNQNTASASEGFLTALKDNLDNVILVGQTSYGKGIGQYTLPLRHGYAVKATTMLWNTPKGINIQSKGVAPDIPYTNNDIIEFVISQLKD